MQATGGKKSLSWAMGNLSLLVQATGRQAPHVWAKGSRGLRATGTSCMIYRWQGQTVVVISEARGRHGLPPLGDCEWAPPAATVTSGVSKNKKEGTATKHHTLLLSPPWNTPALKLPLPNTLGSVQMVDHCPFPRP